MAIAASRIAQVTPRVSNPATETLEMNGVLLSKSEALSPLHPVQAFATSVDVAAFFGGDSPEYKAAAVYFTGFDGSAQKPTRLYIGRWIDKDSPAYIKGDPIRIDWPTWLAEGNGSLTLDVDGEELKLEDLDFAESSSFSEMAQELQSKINTAPEGPAAAANITVEFSAAGNNFLIIAPLDVERLTVTGGNLAERMGISKPTASVAAVHKQTLTEAMDKLAADTPGWVGFSTTWETTTEEALELARWSGAQNVSTLYVHWTSDPELTVLDGEETVIDALEKASVEATVSIFAPDCQLAGFVMGCIASIAYDGNQGTATLAFRQAPGVDVTVSDTQTAALLDGKKVNYYGQFATRNTIFNHFYSGRMYGEYGWVDPYLNAIWLNNSLVNSIISGFRRNNRVPYNDEGYTIVRGWLMGPITTALRNGVIDTGITLSEAQRSEIIREAKQDITRDLEIMGYFVQIQDPDAAARAARQSPIVNLWYTYAGSVHKLQMGSIAIL